MNLQDGLRFRVTLRQPRSYFEIFSYSAASLASSSLVFSLGCSGTMSVGSVGSLCLCRYLVLYFRGSLELPGKIIAGLFEAKRSRWLSSIVTLMSDIQCIEIRNLCCQRLAIFGVNEHTALTGRNARLTLACCHVSKWFR